MAGTEHLTITLPQELAAIVRSKVASGEFASESEYFEAKVVESLFDPVPEDELVQWMNTEGVRRLALLREDPARALSHDEFWAEVQKDDAEDVS